MVLKVGGWVVTVPHIQAWLRKATPPDWENRDLMESPEADDVCFALLKWVEEGTSVLKDQCEILCLPSGKQSIVAYIYRHYGDDDPTENSVQFKPVVETLQDKDIKKKLLAESGLNDEDLPWMTILRPSGYKSRADMFEEMER
ncbi:hypothetical protein M422DRAFT_784394 [Sphaerobolus stellatus SS14]|uniref:Uncharacterized protein n=1 Tax=Sphaerobolus stellatus (strain SS14) TaxID=990650 RepID=A0A0C9TI20_SPHS4|nr:hypothetical protein M422DRAFT_784394 [Sphaerobolus stellatus SS14]